jgi:hypothetical protein
MAGMAASDVYPHLLAFLVANGLTKSAKAFRKETCVEDPGDVDLLAMYEAYLTLNPPMKKKKKRERAAETVAEPEDVEPPAKKKKAGSESPKKSPKLVPTATPESPKSSPKQKPAELPKVKSPKRAASVPPKPEKTEGQGTAVNHFQRVDNEKWLATVKKKELMITAHKEKGGDSWGDKAAEDLLKVKGKDFRKEMAKKKRASWRGGGAIDMSVNSIKFDSDSD